MNWPPQKRLGVHLVDVLAAGTTASRKGEGEFSKRNANLVVHRQHGRHLRMGNRVQKIMTLSTLFRFGRYAERIQQNSQLSARQALPDEGDSAGLTNFRQALYGVSRLPQQLTVVPAFDGLSNQFDFVKSIVSGFLQALDDLWERQNA